MADPATVTAIKADATDWLAARNAAAAYTSKTTAKTRAANALKTSTSWAALIAGCRALIAGEIPVPTPVPIPTPAAFLLEDGSGSIELEDSTGLLLLEGGSASAITALPSLGVLTAKDVITVVRDGVNVVATLADLAA